MSRKNILIARHPETEANVAGRWVGRGNAPFTPLGELQVDAIAAEIVRFEPDVIWSSPLDRARIPASRAAELLGTSHVTDDRLSELDFGAAEGLTFSEAEERGIAFDFKSQDVPVAAGGESRRDILSRCARVLEAALAESDRIAVVTHGGVFRSALVHLLELPMDAIWAFHIRNAGIAELCVGEWGTPDRWARIEEFRLAGMRD